MMSDRAAGQVRPAAWRWPNIRPYSSISCGWVTSKLAVGVSRATRELSKTQNPADGTAVRLVIMGMMPSETVGTDITSSSRPGCPAPARRRTAASTRQAELTISQGDAAKLEWSAAKISRIENARVTVLPATSSSCSASTASTTATSGNSCSACPGKSRQKPWWHHYGITVPDWLQPYAALEAEAAALHYYHRTHPRPAPDPDLPPRRPRHPARPRQRRAGHAPASPPAAPRRHENLAPALHPQRSSHPPHRRHPGRHDRPAHLPHLRQPQARRWSGACVGA
jgi:hypothetical protein